MAQKPKLSDASQNAADFVKVLTTAGAGGLIIGIGLIPNAPTYDYFVRWLLIAGFALIASSIFAGIFALVASFAQPQQVGPHEPQEIDILNWYPFRSSVLIQQQTLLASGLLIGVALVRVMLGEPPLSSLQVQNADRAVDVARVLVPSGETIRKLDHVELVKGVDPGSGANMVWNVEFDVDTEIDDRPHRPHSVRHVCDIMVTTDGKAWLLEGNVRRSAVKNSKSAAE